MTPPGDPAGGASPCFEFATASRIVFGAGRIRELPDCAAALGRRALVVTGSDPARHRETVAALRSLGLLVSEFALRGEPTVATVDEATRTARDGEVDLVIGIGGGSALDAAKAVAALVRQEGPTSDYLEVVGLGRPLLHPALPCITVPTTAGTGAEVTRNAVLGVPEAGVKVSLRGASLLPRLALVDPVLTYGLPPAVTAASGLDALTQLIEAFLSLRANPLVDSLCRDGIPRGARALDRIFRDASDSAARSDLALAALLSGLALTNAGLGAVHGFAAPIGGLLTAPHGAVCAALLPEVLRVNLRVLRERASLHPSLAKFSELAVLLTGDPRAVPDDAITHCAALRARAAIPPLRAWGLDQSLIDEIVGRANRSSSMKGNPLPLTEAELREALEAAR